jgi:hypothetical protein
MRLSVKKVLKSVDSILEIVLSEGHGRYRDESRIFLGTHTKAL